MTEHEGEGWGKADDVAFAFEAIPDAHPVTLSGVFLVGLTRPAYAREVLERLVAPESLPAWGDFSGMEHLLEGLSISSQVRSYPQAPDVAYVYTLRQVTAGIIEGPAVAEIPFVLTWVWRPEFEGWRLHSLGSGLEELTNVVRTSSGVAPDVDAIPPQILQ